MEIIGILIALLMLASGAMLLPNFVKQIANEYARSSGEYAARELSGLITLMRAAENGIIYYQFPKIATYDISIKDRIIRVSPKFKTSLPLIPKNVYGMSYIGVNVSNKEIKNVSELKIVKDIKVRIRKWKE